jgi:hypothetical protein
MLFVIAALPGFRNETNLPMASTEHVQAINQNETSDEALVQGDSSVLVVSKLPQEEQPMLDTPFYVYGLGKSTSTDFWQGDQFFGTIHKVGVLKSVMDEIPNRQAELSFIRDRETERQAYLVQNGFPLDPECKWQVLIERTDVVNGKRRLGVGAGYGKDIAFNGGIGQHVVANVNEIWELQEDGANPILIERHTYPIATTVYTQAEVPSYTPQPPSPPGTIGY